MMATTDFDVVYGIPIAWSVPIDSSKVTGLVIWLPPFGQGREWAAPSLQAFSDLGFAAVSLDPFWHCSRSPFEADELAARAFKPGGFRKFIWPILGQTTLDARHVMDWARDQWNITSSTPVAAGGVSMGGDIAIALAGIDERISRVAAIGSTPDWTRPGMKSFDAPYEIIDQGTASPYAEWFFQLLDPITHADRYHRAVSILFECGEDDTHVPPDGALRLREELSAASPQTVIRIELIPDVGHEVTQREDSFDRSLKWLTS